MIRRPENMLYTGASRTPNKDTKQRLYYAKTRDFYSFTEPQLWIDYDQSSIDTTMIEENGTYYRFHQE